MDSLKWILLGVGAYVLYEYSKEQQTIPVASPVVNTPTASANIPIATQKVLVASNNQPITSGIVSTNTPKSGGGGGAATPFSNPQGSLDNDLQLGDSFSNIMDASQNANPFLNNPALEGYGPAGFTWTLP